MQTLEVTDEQYGAIQRLREAISADVVGKYGFVREQDAVQFLLDNLDGDLEADVATTGGSTATDDVAKAVDAAVSVSYDETSAEAGPDTLEEAGDDDIEDAVEDDSADELADETASDPDADDDTGETSPPADAQTADSDVDGAEPVGLAEESDETDDESDDTEDEADDREDETDEDDLDGDGTADDDDMLDRMMNLLETHDDKWEESPSADYRYRVTLPDGSTADVQTKDDVRAELFKNY